MDKITSNYFFSGISTILEKGKAEKERNQDIFNKCNPEKALDDLCSSVLAANTQLHTIPEFVGQLGLPTWGGYYVGSETGRRDIAVLDSVNEDKHFFLSGKIVNPSCKDAGGIEFLCETTDDYDLICRDSFDRFYCECIGIDNDYYIHDKDEILMEFVFLVVKQYPHLFIK